MGKESHARHDIRREIKKVEAEGAHDIVEEVRKGGGAEPIGEVIDKQGIPIGAGLGESSRDDACGRVPRRLPPP